MAALAAAFRRRAGGDLLQLQQQEADAAASSSSSGSRTPSPTHHGTTAAASGLLPDWPPQGAGAADGFPSSSIWRKHFRGVLRGKLFPLANIWTCALVATVLLALIFRAMQPTEEPGVSILHYAWELDPADDGRVRLDELELAIKGVGRYMMDFPPATLVLRAAPPGEPGPGPMPPLRADEAVEGVLTQMEIPGWRLRLGHDGVTVAVEAASPYFPYRPDAGAEVLATAVFEGTVQVYSRLPARIYMSCRLPASAVATDAPVCWSQYVPYTQKG